MSKILKLAEDMIYGLFSNNLYSSTNPYDKSGADKSVIARGAKHPARQSRIPDGVPPPKGDTLTNYNQIPELPTKTGGNVIGRGESHPARQSRIPSSPTNYNQIPELPRKTGGNTIGREEPHSARQSRIPSSPTNYNQIQDSQRIDHRSLSQGSSASPDFALGNTYSSEGFLGPYTQLTKPTPNFAKQIDPFAIASWLRNISQEFGILPRQHNNPQTGTGKTERTAETITKGLTWAASQFYLASLNPNVPEYGGPANQIWNPLSLPESAIPFMRPDGVGVGVTARAALGEGGSNLLGLANSLTTREKQSIDSIGLSGFETTRPEEVKIPPSLFLNEVTPFIDANSDRRFSGDTISSAQTTRDVGVRLPKEVGGVFEEPIAEGDLAFPFMFQDLRDQPAKFLYFKAFIKSGFAENFTPEWQVNKYYGRVEGIPTYTHTTRTINLSFDVVVFHPADMPAMWKKLHKLQSMVYPAFSSQGYIQSAPIIRLRVGDIIGTASNQGLSGYLNSLNYTYDTNVWTLERDYRSPRIVTINLSFTTLHDGNVGIVDGVFGAIQKKQNQEDNEDVYESKEAETRRIMESVKNYYKNFLLEGTGIGN